MLLKMNLQDPDLLSFAEAMWIQMLGTQMDCTPHTLLKVRVSYRIIPLEREGKLVPTIM